MLGLRCLSPLEVEYWHRKRYFVWISGHFWFKYPSINCLILQGWHGKHISTLYVFLMKSIMPTMNMIWPCLVLVFFKDLLYVCCFSTAPRLFSCLVKCLGLSVNFRLHPTSSGFTNIDVEHPLVFRSEPDLHSWWINKLHIYLRLPKRYQTNHILDDGEPKGLRPVSLRPCFSGGPGNACCAAGAACRAGRGQGTKDGGETWFKLYYRNTLLHC